MALLPTIPSSFVPHDTSGGLRRPHIDFTNAFGLIAYFILGIAFVLAIGVFLYGRILSVDKSSKDASLAKAEAAIDPATVGGFVRLRDRLNSSQTLLANHIALSAFLSSLEALLPSNTRFTTLHISVDTSGAARVEGSGTAKTFNALAAASGAFASDGRIKDVIFSKITINRDNSVSFGFSAALDQRLIAFSLNNLPPSVTATSSTP